MFASVLVAWSLLATGARSQTVPTDFIYRDGLRLMLNGQQYKFAGINADTWFGCWSNEIPSDEQLDRFFRELNPRSMTRIWIMPGSDLSIMDRIVRKADLYNQYLAPVLGNGNGDCDSIGSKSSAWYQSEFRNTYHSHVRNVVSRYKNSRAIGFWEMINEPDGKDPNLKNFYRETSDLIKSIDPLHLIGTGSHAAWSSGGVNAYIDQHDLPNVDLISMHEYDDRDFHTAAEARTAAQWLNKPFYSGEDGFCCGGSPAGTSWAENAALLVAEFNAYLAYPECAGLMYWDFKLGHGETGKTINFGDAGWDVIRTYSHPYRGGPSTFAGLIARLGSSSRVSLSWVDGASDETEYKIERGTNFGAYVQIASVAPNTSIFDDVSVAVDTTYFYRVRAHSQAGDAPYSNVVAIVTNSGSSSNVTVNDNTLGIGQNQFQYVGVWQYASGVSAKYQGDDHFSSTVNAYVDFRFTASQVRLYGKLAPHHGRLAVSIDGGGEIMVDLWAASAADEQLVYLSPVLAVGPHTLRARVAGDKNSNSSGTTVALDKIEVIR